MHFEYSEFYDQAPARKLIDKIRAHDCPRLIHFSGIDLELHENVFAPDLTNTSVLMANCVDLYSLGPNVRVLDLFTGSGLFAIKAAMAGCPTIAVDKETAAVACARHNAALNKVEDLVDVRLGDGLSCLKPTEFFDLVIACPPLLPGVPSDSLESAIVDHGLQATVAVIRGVAAYLRPDASALIMLSDVFDRIGYDLEALAREAGLVVRPLLEKSLPYETYSVYEFRTR